MGTTTQKRPDAATNERRFTVDEYHAMVQAGILTEDDRVELIDGKILLMAPVGNRHAACVKRLTRFFYQHVAERATISVQDPIRLHRSEPEPDVALLSFREDAYADRLPTAEDVLLLVEVADTTLDRDENLKLPVYAAQGIPEVWIVALTEGYVDVYHRPSNDTYASRNRFSRGAAVRSQAFPDVEVPVDNLLGPLR